MRKTDINQTLNTVYGMIPFLLQMPENKMWLDYDKEADVLYINFKKPQRATDSEMLKNGIIIRYKNEDVVGLTILDASKRNEAPVFH
jgi:uncharacterized protein YuzE